MAKNTTKPEIAFCALHVVSRLNIFLPDTAGLEIAKKFISDRENNEAVYRNSFVIIYQIPVPDLSESAYSCRYVMLLFTN